MLDLLELIGGVCSVAEAIQSLSYLARGAWRLAARVGGWLLP